MFWIRIFRGVEVSDEDTPPLLATCESGHNDDQIDFVSSFFDCMCRVVCPRAWIASHALAL